MSASLAAELQAARARLRATADDLGDGREFGPLLPIVNPPRWEVGHVAWFQEYWCLRRAERDRHSKARSASILPNADSLYNSATVPHDSRWELPLPSFKDTLAYREAVLARVLERLDRSPDEDDAYFAQLAARHEQMHAEAFHYTRQTLGYPAPAGLPSAPPVSPASGDVELAGGPFRLGAVRDSPDFAFDNEKWGHRVVLAPFRIARRLVTNAEYLEFVAATGHPAPAHWKERRMRRFERCIDLPLDEPVMHVSALDAEAYCRFAGRRLPTEAEWEFAAATTEGIEQLHDALWQWTSTPFLPYPGYLRDPYAEYSEPWFGNHRVLRGGSFASPPQIGRLKFRNFYTPGRSDIFAGFRTCAA